ncbi:MAG: hypothetical protein FWH08_02410 [Oscillospiraceae bacterium]|nr:hypothetical protein [Oscillospiraceae bacterium]
MKKMETGEVTINIGVKEFLVAWREADDVFMLREVNGFHARYISQAFYEAIRAEFSAISP